MKNNVIFLAVVVLLLTSCAAAPEAVENLEQVQIVENEEVSVTDQGTGPDEEIHADTIAALSDTDLTESEIANILYMREEEKLARDVYLGLADIWGMNIFTNIASSEQTHMESVLTLINFFSLEDPVGDNGVGKFADPVLQSLYDDLMVRGSQSLDEALLVGGAIEEIDIMDLQSALKETSNSAVIEVYQNLLMGSTNHLQSFVSIYERQTGEEYQPQYLSQEAFQDLLDGSSSRSGGGGQGRNSAPQGQGQQAK